MGSVARYLLQHFASTFLSLFGTLFFIVSIIFFIKMARVTAIVEVSFFELGKLYLFVLPQILLFTLPLSFFIGICLSLFRLSKENETIVLFTLGYSPLKIGTFFGILSLLISVALLINSLVLIPISNQLNLNFLDFKKNEAKLNLKASESGQSFSDWIIFVNKSRETKNKKIYDDVIMYKIPDKKQNEKFILSSSANILNEQGQLSLRLKKGKAYDISPKSIHAAQYKNLIIRTKSNSKIRSVNSIFDYWKQISSNKKRAKNFALYVLISIFPLCTFLFAISFGIVTYRYQKNEIYGRVFGVIIAYFTLTAVLSRYYPLQGIGFIFLIFTLVSLIFFRKKILAYY
ncbi:MAG: hypothetical protein CR967_00055 [Proteobacteria bacterium]|nr:MAG: hypothetical protein CR967_00055 [Pseudomonadota bacterium]